MHNRNWTGQLVKINFLHDKIPCAEISVGKLYATMLASLRNVKDFLPWNISIFI